MFMDICRNPMVAHRMLGVSTKFPSGHSNTIGAGSLTSGSWVPNFFKLRSRNSCSDGFAPWKLRFRFKWVAWGYAKQLPLRYPSRAARRACRSRLKSWIYMMCWNTTREETIFLQKKCHWAIDQLPRPSWNTQTDLLMSSDLHFLGLWWNEPLCFQPWSPWVMFRKVHLPKQPWDLGWASPEHQWQWPLQPLHRCGQPAAQEPQIISGVNLHPVTNQKGCHGVSPVFPVSDNPYDSICLWYVIIYI